MAVLALAVSLCGASAVPAQAAQEVHGEVLLTVAPCPPGVSVEAYLDDIAGVAGAYVARTYTALSMDEEDPILLMIRSETRGNDDMIKALAGDRRVYSATPNMVRIRRAPEAKR